MSEGPEVKIISNYTNEKLNLAFIKKVECISTPKNEFAIKNRYL